MRLVGDIILRPGDVFATRNPQGLGKAICFVEAEKSADGQAEYGHSGIITDGSGKTLEAVWTIAEQSLFEAYAGQKTIICRYVDMTPEAFQKGLDSVKGELGRPYPFWRLFLHLFGLGKVHLSDDSTPVCSELTQKFLINAGCITQSGKNWWGLNPDNLVDEWRISRYFRIVWEGIL